MTDGTGKTSRSEREIREIVRDELGEQRGEAISRRGLLGTLGVVGALGLTGCNSDDGSSTPGATQNETPSPTDDRNRSGTPVHSPSSKGRDTPSSTEEPASQRQLKALAERLRDRGYIARKGEIQSTLDDAFADGGGHVGLVGGETYALESSVEVPPGVALDCTGAVVDVRADVNVFELHTQSQVLNPQIRTTGVTGYSSTVFHVYPKQFGDSFGTNRPTPVWTVFGGWSEMTPGEGTCIELHGARENPDGEYNVKRDNRNVYFCFVSHNCIGGRRFAYLHREGGETTRGGHVNGNIVKGFAADATRFVETDDSTSGKNMVNGNKFHLMTQPSENSEWLWYANTGTRNELWEWGNNWDYALYTDTDGDGYPESWYIGPDAGMNFVWRKQASATGGLGSTVVDDSGGESGSRYLLLEQLGVPVTDLDVWDDAE